MNKILLSVSLLLSFLIAPVVFAQITGTSSVASESIDLAKLDYRYNALLEFFLQLTKEQRYEDAYSYMAGNFPKRYNLDDFTRIVNESGLTTFTEKKWTSFKDEMNSIGVTTVKGDFVTPDGVIHNITFFVIIGGETEIKIGHILEKIDVDALAQRFPDNETLAKLIYKDLKKITYLISKRKNKLLYNYLSTPGKQRATLREVSRSTAKFRNKKLNLKLPKGVLINIDNPSLNTQGLMIVTGNYTNAKFSVNFVLAYDYDDWKWRLGGFSFGVDKLTAAR